jgi:uncharacterized Zn-finger protein
MAGPSLSHILDPPMGPSSDSRPLPAPDSVLAPLSVPLSVPVSAPLPPFPLVQQPVVDSDAVPTSTVGSAPSNPASMVPSHIAMPAVPSSTTAPGIATAAAAAGVTPGVTAESSGSASHQSHQNSNPYACRDCGRTYSRPEHLVRHVQTHTLGRRFACEICKKSFARKDLLRRHVTNHENDSPKKRQRMVSSPNSSRVTQACPPCALARVKGDEAKPCRRCVSRNLSCSSYETSPGTSMHLVHLPAGGQDAVEAHPTSVSSVGSTDPNSTLQNASTNLIRDNTTSKSSPLSQSTSSRQDDSQLTTPDMGTDPGKSRD